MRRTTPGADARARLRDALEECERRLVETRTRGVNTPNDGAGYLAVARWEKYRCDLRALVVTEEGASPGTESVEPARDTSPTSTESREPVRDADLARAVDTARAALRVGLPRKAQVEALELLAPLARRRKNRARQFRRAETAHLRSLALARSAR